MAEENTASSSRLSSRVKGLLKEFSFICKLIELLLCIIALALIVKPFNTVIVRDFDHAGIVYIPLGGFIVINAILILSYWLGERVPKRALLMFAGAGALLCFIAGAVLISSWDTYSENLITQYLTQQLNQMISGAVFAMLAALVFAIETFVIFKYE